jgi:hypothetical protein
VVLTEHDTWTNGTEQRPVTECAGEQVFNKLLKPYNGEQMVSSINDAGKMNTQEQKN